MFPTLFRFPTPSFLRGIFPDTIEIHSYGVMIGLGILVSFFIALKKSRKFGMNSDKLSSLFMWVIAAAFIGGKLFFILEDFSSYIDDPDKINGAWGGGFVFYGSLIFAVPTIIIWLRKSKMPVLPFMDILAIVGPVMHSFGRIGCFLAGCCHGKVCDSALGVTFTHPDSMAEPLGVPLYPTQLFDIAVNLLVLAVVLIFQRKKQFDGQMFLIYLMMYAVGRSIVEMFRGDEARGFLFNGSLSHSQFIAIVVILVCTFFWFRLRAKQAR